MPIPLPKTPEHGHPGAVLRERLEQMKDAPSQVELAERLGMSRGRLNELLNESRPVTLDTALRLERLVPEVRAEEWLRMQAAHDLYEARRDRKLRRTLEAIEPLPRADGGETKPVIPLRPAPTPARQALPPLTMAPSLPRLRTREELERELEAVGRERRFLLEYLGKRGLLTEGLRFARIRAQLSTISAPAAALPELQPRPFPDAPEFLSILRGER